MLRSTYPRALVKSPNATHASPNPQVAAAIPDWDRDIFGDAIYPQPIELLCRRKILEMLIAEINGHNTARQRVLGQLQACSGHQHLTPVTCGGNTGSAMNVNAHIVIAARAPIPVCNPIRP